MFRFLGAATLALAAASALIALDFDRERRATPALSLSAYLDQQRLRLQGLLVPADGAAPAKGYDLSRMVTLDSVESTSGLPVGASFLETVNRSVYGAKTRPKVGTGVCRVEGGRKTCSPLTD